MFSKIYRTINSNCKKNIQFVALGSFQIEFFEAEETEYFCVYRYMNENMHHILVELDSVEISKFENGYRIVDGIRSYKIKILRNDDKIKAKITQYFWGWLPYQRFGGKISVTGLATLESMLTSRFNSITPSIT